MLDENKKRRLDAILAELAELNERDLQFIQPRSTGQEPIVSVPIGELFAHGERRERRTALHNEMAELLRDA